MVSELHPDAEKFRRYLSFSKAPSTVYNYSRNVSRFLVFIGKPYQETEPLDITDWYKSLEEDDGLAPRSIWRFGHALRSFFSTMGMWEMVHQTPIVQYETPDPKWLTRSQTMGVISGVPVLTMGYALALRVGELRFLSRETFDQESGLIQVTRLKHKGQRNTYILELDPWALGELNEYLAGDVGDKMFPMSVSTIQDRFNERAAPLGLREPGDLHTFHCLRHSKVTHLAVAELQEKGVVDELSLSKFAGHLRVETTRLYVHLAARHLAFKS